MNVRLALGLGCVMYSLLPSVALAANPVPVTSGQVNCSTEGYASVNLPAVSAAYQDLIYSFSSNGPSIELLNGAFDQGGANTLSSGETIWGNYGAVSSGASPFVGVDCVYGSGSATVTLYAAPTASATFSGTVDSADSPVHLPFSVPGTAQYVADVQISQGAIQVGIPEGTPTTVGSSQEVPLGSEPKGLQEVAVSAMPGPTPTFSVTIRALPVAISGLTFLNNFAQPGKAVTAKFSVDGSTTLTAQILGPSGHVVDALGSFAVAGSSSVTWNGRLSNGTAAPTNTYTLLLSSLDADGNTSASRTSIQIDGTPPTITPTAPLQIKQTQDWSVRIVDHGSGVASAELFIDGKENGHRSGNGSLIVAGPKAGWAPGPHTYRVVAVDRAGNRTVKYGTFSACGPVCVATSSQARAMIYSVSGRYYGDGGSVNAPRSVPLKCFLAIVTSSAKAATWGAWTFSPYAYAAGHERICQAGNGVAITHRIGVRWYVYWEGSSGSPPTHHEPKYRLEPVPTTVWKALSHAMTSLDPDA